jgi:hypothetical protein
MTSLQQQRLKAYLDHMIQAIEQVCEYLADVTEARFLSNRLLQYFGGDQVWERDHQAHSLCSNISTYRMFGTP